MLVIAQILTQLQRSDNMCRLVYTYVEQRYMEHVIYSCRSLRQHHTLCHEANPLQHLQRSNIARTQLSSHFKMLNASCCRDLQEHMISYAKLQIASAFVRVALLPTLHHQKPLVRNSNLVFDVQLKLSLRPLVQCLCPWQMQKLSF